MNRCVTFGCLLVAVTFTLSVGVGRSGAQEIRIDKVQKALVLFASGKQYTGELQLLTAKEVRFKIAGFSTALTYPAEKVKAVQIRDDTYIYNPNKGTFESARALQASARAPVVPEPPREKPAPVQLPDAPPAAGEASKTQTVIAEGVGVNEEKALKDAFRNAVQQVVGAVVDAETRVKNDEVIADRVLTYSDGFIKSYKKVSEKHDDGMHRLKITAEVERRSVVEKLQAANVTVKNVDGGSLFAEVVTGLEAQKTAAELIQTVLDDYPANVVKAEVLGKPKVVNRSETQVTLEYPLKIAVDPEKYERFLQRAVPVLDKIAVRKATIFTPAEESDRRINYQLPTAIRSARWRAQKTDLNWEEAQFVGVKHIQMDRNTQWVGENFDPSTDMVLLANTTRNALHNRLGWRVYQVSRPRAFHIGLAVEVVFLDNEQKELTRDMVRLAAHPGISLTEKYDTVYDARRREQRQYPFAVLSPYFLVSDYGDWTYAVHIISPQQLTVSLDELRRMESIRCSVRQSEEDSEGPQEKIRPRFGVRK